MWSYFTYIFLIIFSYFYFKIQPAFVFNLQQGVLLFLIVTNQIVLK
jgi:hypothetical protein